VRPTPHRDDESLTCPPWCRRDHHADVPADDRLHQSSPEFVAAVLGEPRFGDEEPRPDSLVLRLVQRHGSATVWLEVASEEGGSLHLLVSAESARRLVGAVTALLAVL
jgi:hypothetical protein